METVAGDWAIKTYCIKTWANTGLFLLIFVFSALNNSKIDESIDGVLGTRTQGRRTEDADEYTELWRHPVVDICFPLKHLPIEAKRFCSIGPRPQGHINEFERKREWPKNGLDSMSDQWPRIITSCVQVGAYYFSYSCYPINSVSSPAAGKLCRKNLELIS